MTVTRSAGVGKVVPPQVPNPPVGTVTGAPSAAPMPSTLPNKPPSVGTARPLPPPKPPQPRNPVPLAGRAPPAPGSVKPVQVTVKASELTPEHLFQRLYFLEGLYRHQRAYIKDLTGRLQRTGTAVPTMPHFDALKSPAGDIDPNVV